MDNFSDGVLTEAVKEIPKPYRTMYRAESLLRDYNSSLDWAIGLVETVRYELSQAETEQDTETVMSRYGIVLDSNQELVERANAYIAGKEASAAIAQRNKDAIDELFTLAETEPYTVAEFTQLFNRYLHLAGQVSGEDALTQQTRDAAENSRLRLIADHPKLYQEFRAIMAAVVADKASRI